MPFMNFYIGPSNFYGKITVVPVIFYYMECKDKQGYSSILSQKITRHLKYFTKAHVKTVLEQEID